MLKIDPFKPEMKIAFIILVQNFIPYYAKIYQNTSKFILQFELEVCKLGEVYHKALYACEECPLGTFSFSPLIQLCNLCPKEALECQKNNINLKDRYYISNYWNLNIYLCVPLGESCL